MKEELRKASSVFLDTSTFIYHVEKHSDYFPVTNELFIAIDRGETHGSAECEPSCILQDLRSNRNDELTNP